MLKETNLSDECEAVVMGDDPRCDSHLFVGVCLFVCICTLRCSIVFQCIRLHVCT